MPAGAKLLEANRLSTEMLLGGVAVAGLDGWDGGRDQVADYIDWDDWEANDFLAVSQFAVVTLAPAPNIRPDVTLFVNGGTIRVFAILRTRRWAGQRRSTVGAGGHQRMITLPEYEAIIADPTKRTHGSVRVRTPFMYPDGGIVDVFVQERDGESVVTDYGESLGWLQTQSVRDQMTGNQRQLVEDVCLTLGVQLDRGQLTLRCTNASALGDAIHRLGQAVVRVCDIWSQPEEFENVLTAGSPLPASR